jgi:hypothetical protein
MYESRKEWCGGGGVGGSDLYMPNAVCKYRILSASVECASPPPRALLDWIILYKTRIAPVTKALEPLPPSAPLLRKKFLVWKSS